MKADIKPMFLSELNLNLKNILPKNFLINSNTDHFLFRLLLLMKDNKILKEMICRKTNSTNK